jgi:hypothetical protein
MGEVSSVLLCISRENGRNRESTRSLSLLVGSGYFLSRTRFLRQQPVVLVSQPVAQIEHGGLCLLTVSDKRLGGAESFLCAWTG